MGKNILVIGGTRYIGKLLVQRLIAGRNSVTIATRGRTADPFGERISRIRVDRRDESAMRAAFADADFDVVYDQMLYSPLDAAIAARVFAGRTRRYIVASTIEVYRGLLGQQAPFAEEDLNLQRQRIDSAFAWHDPAHASASYVAGKLQAEAYLYRDGTLPLVTVRSGHVLGGPEDFTGRLAHYVDAVRQRATMRYASTTAATSFISAPCLSDFLAWAGNQSFTGPVNAACEGPLSAYKLIERVGLLLGEPVRTVAASLPVRCGELSPFDYPAPYWMDTSRASELGYRFGHSDDWLDGLILKHDLAFV